MLAIALGLINQVTNIGNLSGPAAMAFTVQWLGWGARRCCLPLSR